MQRNIFCIFILICLFEVTFIQKVTSQNIPVTGKHNFTSNSVLSQGKWVKIAVDETAIFQITFNELTKLGFSKPQNVAIFGKGGNILNEDFSVDHYDDLKEIPIYYDDKNKRILFYGIGSVKWDLDSKNNFIHNNNPYSDYGYYFLTEKDSQPLYIENITVSQADKEAKDSYLDFLLHEIDEVNLGKSGRELYGESFLYTQSRDYKFSIPKLTGNIDITIDFVAKSLSNSSLSLSVNGQSQFSNNIPAISDEKFDYGNILNEKISFNNLEGLNDFTLRLNYSHSNALKAHLNYIKLQFQRELKLTGENYLFFRGDNQFVINDYSENYIIWDINDNYLSISSFYPLLIEDQKYGFKFNNSVDNKFVILNTDSKFPSVDFVGEIPNQNLHSLEQCDMVIVTTSELKAQAERLAKYRSDNDGLIVHVVEQDKIFNEFSSGTPDATALRLFMKMFYDRSVVDGNKPRYLLLFGDGSYDNRAKNSSIWTPAIMKNMLLTYQTENSINEMTAYVSDDYYGFLDDNEGGKKDRNNQIVLNEDKLDIGIGRIPVRTVLQSKNAVDKIINYSENKDNGNWKNQLCFLGDDGDANLHVKHAESMIDVIKDKNHNEYIFNKIYLDAFKLEKTSTGNTYPDARKKFLEQLNSGVLLINFSGHGSTTNLTSEGIFSIRDAESIEMKRLPVWVTATCDYSRFDDVDTSAGESLLLNPNGGAIALFTTTRIVYSDGNLLINKELVNNLFEKNDQGRSLRMGDVMKNSKLALGNNINKMNFILLGDPSMRINYPEHKINITHINEQPVSESPVQLKALSKVTIKGEIRNLLNDGVQDDFFGDISSLVYDSEETIKTLDNLNTGNPFEYTDRNNMIFSGTNKIESGVFEISFIVPKDISYSMKTGLINLYAVSKDGVEANGFFDKFILGGTSEDIEDDVTPPDIISMYLNQESFKNGDVVNSTPYFVANIEDDFGINSTGNSIGHDIEIIIKGNGKVFRYNLNNYFITEPGHSTKGTVMYQIPKLDDGSYELEFKVWDLFNNSASESLNFKVNEKDKPQILKLTTDKNPATDNVNFLIYHNRPESKINVSIEVFTYMGQSIWNKNFTTKSEVNEPIIINWNIKNLSGQTINHGIYLYRVSISTDNSNSVSKSSKLLINTN